MILDSTHTLLSAQGIKKFFPMKTPFFSHKKLFLKAVDGVDLHIQKGESLGIVGESGCGKSTLGRCIIRLYEPTAGSIHFMGQDFLSLKNNSLRQARQNMQMIFQDPYASLDPRMTVSQIIEQSFKIHGLFNKQERKHRVQQLLEQVGLDNAYVNRYPHEFSGGQRQRISLARALSLNPSLIIADEPVSALDVSIQAQILNLMKDLQKEFNLTYLFISHDLSVVEHFCNRIAVMYLGKIVELASRKDLFCHPKHPYTQALLEAIPQFNKKKEKSRKTLQGEVPSPLSPPSGCAFHPRCPHAMNDCKYKVPQLKSEPTAQGEHHVACLLYRNKLEDQ